MSMATIIEPSVEQEQYSSAFHRGVKERSDKLMNYFLIGYFLIGLGLALFYGTWFIAIGVGSISLLAYYSVKIALPNSKLYQYMLGAVLGIFMAQYIYQMHGLFEMHFVAFISSAVLITYQNWKLQIPLAIFVVLHHAIFGYMQNIGQGQLYFSQLDYFDFQTFVIHILLACILFFICGLWAYHLKKSNEIHTYQILKIKELEKESLLLQERARSEESLKESNEELKKTNAELDKFVYSVSHDLRAPLASMLGLIDISEDETESTSLLNNFGMLKSSIKKLDSFIEDILNYSRNAREAIKWVEIDFPELVNGIVNDLKHMNRDRKVNIELDIHNTEPFVSDRHRLGIILSNLIANAIYYHNPQEPNPFVQIKVSTDMEGASITISDNGVGIKKSLQHKVFDMFYRISQNSQGSGLGLYIVKETLQKLDGTIDIDSEPGTGTSFSIHIPRGITQTKPIKQKTAHAQENNVG